MIILIAVISCSAVHSNKVIHDKGVESNPDFFR